MKKFIKSFILLAFMALLINVGTLKAADKVVPVDGASIRFKTEVSSQGLRFYAKLDSSVKDEEHGFYLVYGKATVNELDDAIVEAGSGPITLNGKTVFKVVVPGVTANNEFSVVLTGIPEVGYFDEISVFPYVKPGASIVLPASPVTRSVAAVVLNMANAGEDISKIENSSAILATPKKKVGLNPAGNLEVSSGVYELNYFNLGKEFLKDWNKLFNLELEDLDAAAFYASAADGSPDAEGVNKDLSETNLYKFFNNPKLKDKWDWILTFMKSVDGTTHTTRQIDAVLGNGKNEDLLLYNGTHLSYSLTNFFNEEYEIGNYQAINFTELHRYNELATYNNKVYVSVENYSFYNVGESIVLPAPSAVKEGYNFANYKVGSTNYNPGSIYVVSGDAIIEPVYTPISYTVKFYDGSNEVTVLATSYNIESGLILPSHSKEGSIFRGWYDNALLEGSAVTSIAKGVIGNKVYYAKWAESALVTYHLGDYGYHTSTKTKADLFEEFVTDYKAIFGRGATVEVLMADFFNNSYLPEQYNIMDIFTYENNRYGWLKEHILSVSEKEAHEPMTKLLEGEQAEWRREIEAFFTEKQVGNSLDFSMEKNAHNFWQYTDYGVYEEDFVANGPLFNNVLTDSKIYGFVGFKDKDNNVVTQLPAASEGLDLYAIWERSAFYVRFNIGYAASSPATQLVLKNALVAEPAPAPRAGYTFKGWYKNLADENAYSFSTPVTEDFMLYAKWEEEALAEYNITYNLDGGKVIYATKDELINGFLDDFYKYLNLSSSINDFKHGTGNTTGYDGQWHSVYKAKIYSGPRPTAVNNEYFASSAEYMDKWLPFFDMVDVFIKEVNDTQYFWGAGTSVGLIRIRQYIINVKPAAYVSDDTMAMLPEDPIEAPKILKGKVNVPLTLQQAYKEGKTFAGWYLTSDFSGAKVTELNQSTAGDVTLYAKFE